ncbi:MAG: hypothetical protein ABF266_01080, partial [Celeribacter marinus]
VHMSFSPKVHIERCFLRICRGGPLCCAAHRINIARMKKVPKPNTDDALIQEFLNKGGKVSVGKTKPLPAELGLSKNVWNNKLTKEEKAARDKK